MLMYITWFSSFTCYYLHLGLKYFLNTVFSNSFGLCWSHNVRDKLSHTYKREASYISLYLNFYIFGKQIERRKILDRMLPGVLSAQSTPNLFMRTVTNTVG